MSRIYADHNATSPLLPELTAQAEALLTTGFANPSSPHAAGREARALIEDARAQIAALALTKRVVFTASATEANVLALQGKAIVSAIEHPSVLENADKLVAPVTRDGVVDLDALDRMLPGSDVCAVMWANNETGIVQPIDAVAALCRKHGVRFHIDAVQGLGKLPPRPLPCDTFAISAHKIGALPGLGALCINGVAPAPLLTGGGQQDGLRGGTEPVPQIVLFGAAARLWREHGDEYRANMLAARDAFELGMGVHNEQPRLPNTSNVRVPGVRGQALLSGLDLAGVAASHGAACATGALDPSHVLIAMGLSEAEVRTAIRVSFGPHDNAEIGREVARRVLRCAERLRTA